ncbi:MAG TPA: hypothetical protein VHE54_00765, partial [Puia sp.]|nr:hypothetical protein [Puia sp.]
MKKLTVQIVIHIAAWLCFLLLPILFYPRPREVDYNFFVDHFLTPLVLISNLYIIAFYYLNTYLFLPRLFDRKRFVFYTVLILGLLVIYGFLGRIYHGIFGYAVQTQAAAFTRPPSPRVRPLVNAANIAVFLMVFVFSTGIRVINQWLR